MMGMTPDNIGVHAHSTDIFPYPVHNKQVHFLKGQTGHE